MPPSFPPLLMFPWMLLKPANLLSLWVHCLNSCAGAGKAGKSPISPGHYAVSCAVLSRSVVSSPLQPHVLQPARLPCPWGFSRQEYWSGLPCPPPGDLPNPGIEPRSPALQVDSLLSEPPGKPMTNLDSVLNSKVITLSTKVCIVKAMVFPVVTYRCES